MIDFITAVGFFVLPILLIAVGVACGEQHNDEV